MLEWPTILVRKLFVKHCKHLFNSQDIQNPTCTCTVKFLLSNCPFANKQYRHSQKQLTDMTCCSNYNMIFISDQIRDAMNKSLATKVQIFCKNSQIEKVQPLLELFGKQFMERYLPDMYMSHHNQVNFPD